MELVYALGERLSDDNLADPDYVLMTAGHKGVHFTQSSDWETIALLVEFELLECNDVPRLLVLRAVHDAVGALLDLVEALEGVDGAS